ncbi:MAG: GntR family transcriptional regulator [Clostridia bacterium]|nr:GntR family transcriptional regulator [Clostridia bacterium]
MINFDALIIEDGIPIYLQIVRHIKRGIVSGVVKDRDELPSRRVLSAFLGVNPNTIQKAYRILEDEALIESHSGAKSYMSLDGARIAAVRDELVEADAKSSVEALKQMGVTKEQAIALIEKYWEE